MAASGLSAQGGRRVIALEGDEIDVIEGKP
jgi:hypothetical protein